MSQTTTKPVIEALIFDMDGLLVDSEPLTDIALEALLDRYGCTIVWEAQLVEQLAGRRMPEILEVVAGICGITTPPREFNEELEALRLETLRGRLLPCPGARELVAFGRDAGLPLALATSGRRSYVDAVLAETGFTGMFAAEVTGEEVERGKPAPDVYLRAASRLGVSPSHCVVFEDAPAGITAAVAAGMRAVAVPNVYTRDLNFPSPPETVLPDLHAVIPWLAKQGVGSSTVNAAGAR